MKKAILIFIVTLLFTSCLEEEWDDCNSTLWLTFQHAGEFDEVIGNDVRVYVYKNDKFHHQVLIPFSEIQGGKEYPLKKSFSGQLSIAAWAVPRIGGNPNVLPDKQNNFSTFNVGHADVTRNDFPLCLPVDSLYLGTLNQQESVLKDSHHTIEMENIICEVEVVVKPTSLIKEHLANGPLSTQVGGSARGLTLDKEPHGEEVLVYADMKEDTQQDIYSTSVFGIMPSFDGNKTVTATVYAGETLLFTVNSKEISRPGDKIKIVIVGTTAEISINGWRVGTVSVII